MKLRQMLLTLLSILLISSVSSQIPDFELKVLDLDTSPGYITDPDSKLESGGKIFITTNGGSDRYDLFVFDGTSLERLLSNQKKIRLHGKNNNGVFFTISDSFSTSTVYFINHSTLEIVLLQETGPRIRSLISFGDKVVFIKTFGSLYASDGTPSGTTLLHEFSGYYFLDEYDFNLNGVIVFNAENQLWRTDGTIEGTFAITSNLPTFPNAKLVRSGNYAYYVRLVLGTSFWQLWKTDGITAEVIDSPYGFTRIEEIHPIESLENGILFVGTNAEFGREVWVSDGTVAGTQLLMDLSPGAESGVYDGFTFFYNNFSSDGEFFFRGQGVHAQKIWKTDGTINGTNIVVDFSGQPEYEEFGMSEIAETEDNKRFFFTRNDMAEMRLWVYQQGDVEAQDLGMIPAESYFFVYPSETKIFFEFYNDGDQIWTSDGTIEGTTNLATIGGFEFLGTHNDLFYYTDFSANPNALRGEPYISNGTIEGTGILKDINEGISSSDPDLFFIYNDNSYFYAVDHIVGQAIYTTGGTETSTIPVADFYPNTLGQDTENILTAAGKIFFRRGNGNKTLWATDGTVEGSYDLNVPVSNVYEWGSLDEKFFFTSGGAFDELWVTDGTSQGTQLLLEGNGINNAFSSNRPIRKGNYLYFFYDDGINGKELYQSDGTVSGTQMVFESMPGAETIFKMLYSRVGTDGENIFFNNVDDIHGNELWVSDGTLGGTFMLKDLTPGSQWSQIGGFGFIHFNDKIYFTSNNYSSRGTWVSDGTTMGTMRLTDTPFESSNASVSIGDFLFFSGDRKIWKTDGTLEGTQILSEYNSTPSSLTKFGDKIYFTAPTPPNYDHELHVTNGTEDGTQLFFNPGQYNSPGRLNVIGDYMFFLVSNSLWVTNGTVAGTASIDFTYSELNSIYEMIAYECKLFFPASSFLYGEEIHYLDFGDNIGCTENIDCGAPLVDFTELGSFDNSYYYLSNDPVNWQTASSIAESHDGHLVSINTQEENDFLKDQINEIVFIGWSDRGEEGNFVWDSGEPITLNNFTDSNTEEKDFGKMNFWNGNWGVDNQYVSRKYIVEIPCNSAGEVELTYECSTFFPLTGDWSIPITIDNNTAVDLPQQSLQLVLERTLSSAPNPDVTPSSVLINIPPIAAGDSYSTNMNIPFEAIEQLAQWNPYYLPNITFLEEGINQLISNRDYYFSLTSPGFEKIVPVDFYCKKYETDLSVDIQASSEFYSSNGEVSYNVEITNNGSEKAYNINATIGKTFVPIDPVPTLSPDIISWTSSLEVWIRRNKQGEVKWFIPELAPGMTTSVQVIYDLNGPEQLDILPNEWTVEVDVTSGHLVDSDVSNNIDFYTFLQGTQEGIIDLNISNVYPVLGGGFEGFFGDLIDYTIEIENLGSGTISTFFDLDLYYSLDSIYDSEDFLGGGFVLDELSENSRILEGRITIPTLPPGDYYIIASVDDNDVIEESNENNNIFTIPMTVLAPVVNNCNASLEAFTFLAEYNNHNYYISDADLKPEDAKQVAIQNGGYLAAINNQFENNFILSQINQQNISELVYIGLSDEMDEGNLSWMNGDSLDFMNFDFCSFCNTNSDELDYVVLHPWNGGWSYSSRFNQRRFILEIPCEVGAIELPDLTSTDLELSTDSVKIGDQLSYSYLVRNIGNGNAIGGVNFSKYISSDTIFDSGDDYLGGSMSTGYTAGAIGYVNGQRAVSDLPDGEYYFLVVSDAKQYVYESNEENNVTFARFVVYSEGSECTNSLQGFDYLGEFEDSKYFLSETTSKPTDAQAVAEANGGYLAVINSQAENNFLQAQIDGVIYIGLNDFETEGTLNWANGDPVSFTNFDDCSICNPNADDKDFVMIQGWNGGWSFSNFYNSRKYIVEIPCTSNSSNLNISISNPSFLNSQERHSLKKPLSLVQVHPNPAMNFIYTTVNSPSEQQIAIQIYNIYGGLVKSTPIELVVGKNVTRLSIADLQSGIYTLFIPDAQGRHSTVRFVKIEE